MFAPAAGAPAFNAFLYTLDQMLPIIDLGYAKWVPGGVAQVVSTVTTIFGWVFVTALLAALTGLLRRGD